MCNYPEANCIDSAYVSVGEAIFGFIVVVVLHAKHWFYDCPQLHVDAVI